MSVFDQIWNIEQEFMLKINTNEELKKFAKAKNWVEKGTESNPYIIDSYDEANFLLGKISTIRSYDFYRTTLYIHIKNIDILRLTCGGCENVTIDNCNVNELSLYGCSKIKVYNSSLYTQTLFRFSEGITISNSRINHLKLVQSYKNTFKTCSIKRYSSSLSRSNIFEKNDISYKILKKISKFQSRDMVFGLLCCFMLMIMLVILLAVTISSQALEYIWIWIILLAINGYGFYSFIKIIKKAKKHPPNIIIEY